MLTSIDGQRVPRWVRAELRFARRHGWRGHVVSGWRSDADQLAAAKRWASSQGMTLGQMYPNGPLASNHCGRSWPRGAVDVTDAPGLARALRFAHRRPRGRRLVWALDVGFNDPPHFSRSGR